MNRREVLSALTAACGATGLKSANIKVIDRDPAPLMAVIECDEALTPARVQALRDAWNACRTLNPEIPPCVVLERGVTVSFKTALDP